MIRVESCDIAPNCPSVTQVVPSVSCTADESTDLQMAGRAQAASFTREPLRRLQWRWLLVW
jgi:hypothetical protein